MQVREFGCASKQYHQVDDLTLFSLPIFFVMFDICEEILDVYHTPGGVFNIWLTFFIYFVSLPVIEY